jgi:hypothetical protein
MRLRWRNSARLRLRSLHRWWRNRLLRLLSLGLSYAFSPRLLGLSLCALRFHFLLSLLLL